MSNNKDDFLLKLGKYGSTSIENVMQTRNVLYYKNNKCLNCKYNIICDGIEKTNTNEFDKYIKPSNGKIIKDPLFYLKNKTEKIYNELYGN
jgi:deoxycytidylate deaminase